ncbi:cyclin-D5-1-like [Cannabis sativa]|uniref:B-like cyclin n=1 Tax=Cannabis sativa TaxID=3483 RepID=A0A803NJK6_CANSA|nr:cyclin-D5-1-like [Cannabis sativa]
MDNDSFSSHLSRESETLLEQKFEDDEGVFINFRNMSPSEEEEHVINLLIEETEFVFKKDESLVFGDEVEYARLEAINWIVKTGAAFGFQKKTAYLSMIYFDRYLWMRPIETNRQIWLIGLLSVAALRVAAKMEEPKIPSVSKFRYEYNNVVESKVIGRMELLLLNTFDWKLPSVTPFAFLHYFVTRLCQESPPRNLLSRISALIMATLNEINIVEYRPSIIAAGATLVALNHKMTKSEVELKMNSIPHHKSLNIEDVFSCYNLIQELKIDEKTSILSSPIASSFTNELHNERERPRSDEHHDERVNITMPSNSKE